MKFSRTTIACLLAYVGMIGISTFLMFYARSNLLATFDTPEAHAEWQEWRDKAAHQAKGEESVQRKVPKSVEPPALVLMRDHFASCLTMVLLICSTMFGALVFFLQGALAPVAKSPGTK